MDWPNAGNIWIGQMLEIYGLAKCWKYVDWPNAGNIWNGPKPISNKKGGLPPF